MEEPPAPREVSALFEPDVDLSSVVSRLEQAGVTRDAVIVCSPLPLKYGAPEPPMLPYWITMAAGIVGIGVGVFFAAGTAALYPLMTGGKSIVAAPVVGIISYETMMLLAVLATFVTMIIRIRRHRGVGPRDSRIDDGMTALIVTLAPDASKPDVLRILDEAGATDIDIVSARSPHQSWTPSRQAPVTWALLVATCGLLGGCSRDMQDQPSYQPQEPPRLHSPAGSVPRDSRTVLSAAQEVPATGRLSGEQVYRVNCLHCHGPNGEGNGPVALYLKEKPANLHSGRIQDKTQAEIYEIVSHGKDVMPAFRGELSADERWAVATYVKKF